MMDDERLKQWEENSKLENDETRKILEKTYWLSAEEKVKEYSLEALYDKFVKDAMEARERHEELKKQYIETWPDSPLPDHYKNEYFCFPLALSIITKKLMELHKVQDK